MVIDDQLNILPISSHTLTITALPPKSKVKLVIPIVAAKQTNFLIFFHSIRRQDVVVEERKERLLISTLYIKQAATYSFTRDSFIAAAIIIGWFNQ